MKQETNRLRLAVAIASSILLGCAATAWAQISSSTSYVISQSTLNGGGGSSMSTSFRLDGSVAQPATVGEASSGSFVLQSGFWTSLSTRLVVRVEGTGTGRGTVTGPGIACTLDAGVASGDCTETVTRGSSIDLVATPDAMNQFDDWAGCDATATTNAADDTCRSTVFAGRTLTASFTRLGSVGDRVWRDVDGDGVQDLGEPGLDSVSVTIDDGVGLSGSVTASGGGHYQFFDVPPGSFTVTVDDSTLPPGLAPSFDADGIGTPNAASFTLTDGAVLAGIDFGYQPFVDLTITQEDSVDPLPGGQNLVYTITVSNSGPSYATDVVVTDALPTGTTLVASAGCAEDPAGAPTCSLGTMLAGDSVQVTLEVSIDPAPPGSIINVATVSSAEADLNVGDNSASQSTELDDVPMVVTWVQAQPPTADGVLSECETVNARDIGALRVQFDESALNPVGDGMPGDVTNPTSWSLVFTGDDAEFSTTACGVPAGDDESVALDGIVYDSGSRTATLVPDGELAPGLYRLFACGTGANALTDLAGNPLDGDGDGTAGGDFVRGFRADPENLFSGGHFDCGLGIWDTSSPKIAHSEDDLDDSADSGSAAVVNVSSSDTYEFDQCVELAGEEMFRLEGGMRLGTEGPAVTAQLVCEFFAGTDCDGASTGSARSAFLVADTGISWVPLEVLLESPSGTASARCGAKLSARYGDAFDARLDQIRLLAGTLIFEDGFESGDTTAWSSTIPTP